MDYSLLVGVQRDQQQQPGEGRQCPRCLRVDGKEDGYIDGSDDEKAEVAPEDEEGEMMERGVLDEDCLQHL